MMLSFAQQGEDVLLRRLFARNQGFYIDVGANHPLEASVTKHFYDEGWHGINLEPGGIFDVLYRERPRDINLRMGASNREGTLILYEFPSAHGISTFAAEEAEAHRRRGWNCVERAVAVTTLAKVCTQYVDRDIDFISIDVEGHERAVLEGADWKRWRPLCVVVESTRPLTSIPTHHEWEPLLVEVGYVFATFDGLNRYYIRCENKELCDLLRLPVNFFDDYFPFHHLSPPARVLVLELRHEIQRLRDSVQPLQRMNELYCRQLTAMTSALISSSASVATSLARISDPDRRLLVAEKMIEGLFAVAEQASRKRDEAVAALRQLEANLEQQRETQSKLRHAG